MILRVTSFEDVEMIRDGGSYSATFRVADGRRLILFSKVMIEIAGATWKKLGFKPPVLIDTAPAFRPPNDEQAVSSELSGPQTPITWHDARVLISACRRLSAEMSDRHQQWFDEFEYVIFNDGAWPPSK